MTNNIKSYLGIALLFLSFLMSTQEATPPLDIPLLLSGIFFYSISPSLNKLINGILKASAILSTIVIVGLVRPLAILRS
tara:strand:+ start:148 stop:384 length:237 start_codon:yes stop_codon:yes gene_type:complete